VGLEKTRVISAHKNRAEMRRERKKRYFSALLNAMAKYYTKNFYKSISFLLKNVRIPQK